MRRLCFLIGVLCSTADLPGVAVAQVSLTEINAAGAISQDMQGRNARAVTGAGEVAGEEAATPQATESVGLGGVKYIPAYAIVLMLVGLSTFVVCRPSRRHAAD